MMTPDWAHTAAADGPRRQRRRRNTQAAARGLCVGGSGGGGGVGSGGLAVPTPCSCSKSSFTCRFTRSLQLESLASVLPRFHTAHRTSPPNALHTPPSPAHSYCCLLPARSVMLVATSINLPIRALVFAVYMLATCCCGLHLGTEVRVGTCIRRPTWHPNNLGRYAPDIDML
jgi:hypothetical protein